MMINKVEICGVNTAKLPVISASKMRELFVILQSGELSAREKLIHGNLRLVLSVIQRFNNLSQNVKFSTYAVTMIIGEIRRYLRDNNPIRVSRSMRDVAYKALQVRDSLINRYSREPSINEIASELKIQREEVVFALDAIQEPISLFEPIYHDGGDPIFVMDQIGDDKNLDMNWLESVAIKDALHKLSQREKHILTLRFFEGKTQMEVAEEIGISQAQVSRLEKAALGHMRKHI